MCLRITCARKEQCSYKKVYIMKARLVWIYSKHFFVEKWLLFYPLLLWHILFLFAKEAFKLAPLKIHFFSSFAMYLIQITAGWEGVLPLLPSLWPATCCYSRSSHCRRYGISHGPQWERGFSVFQIRSKILPRWGPTVNISEDGPARLWMRPGIWYSSAIHFIKSFKKIVK